MSSQIDTAHVDTYNDGIELLAQQMESRVVGRVRREAEPGDDHGFDQIGLVASKTRSAKAEDHAFTNTPYSKRWVSASLHYVADIFGRDDLIKLLNAPMGTASKAFMASLNRERDEVCIAAALGSAVTGPKDAKTTTALPAGQTIVHGSVGLTFAKLKLARQKFNAAESIDDDEVVSFFYTSAQENDLLGVDEIINADYNTRKVLEDGTMQGKTFMGFDFVRLEDWVDEAAATHEILPIATTTRSCVAIAQNGLVFNEPDPVFSQVSQREDKHFDWQLYTSTMFGAGRLQETKVVEVECTE